MDYLDIFKKSLYDNDWSYLYYAIFNEKNAFIWFISIHFYFFFLEEL